MNKSDKKWYCIFYGELLQEVYVDEQTANAEIGLRGYDYQYSLRVLSAEEVLVAMTKTEESEEATAEFHYQSFNYERITVMRRNLSGSELKHLITGMIYSLDPSDRADLISMLVFQHFAGSRPLPLAEAVMLALTPEHVPGEEE